MKIRANGLSRRITLALTVVLVSFTLFAAGRIVDIPLDVDEATELKGEIESAFENADPHAKRQLLLIRLNFFDAIGAGKETNDRTIELAKEFLREVPGDPFAEAVIHASVCRGALYESTTGKQTLAVRKCMIRMNKLLKKHPDDLNLLTIRAATYSQLPKIFKTRKRVVQDYEKIFALSAEGPDALRFLAALELSRLLEESDPQKSREYANVANDLK